MIRHAIFRLFAVATVSACLAPQALAQAFAGEDFDGGTTNGGFTAVTQVLTPDNSGSASPGRFDPVVTDMPAPTAPFFDLFGIVNQVDSNLPFDLVDTSLADDIDTDGILRSTDLDNVVALADVVNGDNPAGSVTGTWTFDITGRSNIELSIDFAAQGDFEDEVGPGDEDIFNFTYSIDGGPQLPAFTSSVDEAGSIFPMPESGNTFQSNFFFDELLFDELLFSGPFSFDEDGDPLTGVDGNEISIDFDPADDGVTNGDTTAQDGLVVLDFGDGPENVRSFQLTDTTDPMDPSVFVNPELEPLEAINDPVSINGTTLTNVLTTLTTGISGTGSTLTLSFISETNGSGEFFVFDDILLSEDGVGGVLGDTDGDGDVDLTDLFNVQNNFGGMPPLLGDTDGDGDIDLTDLFNVQNNFGAVSGTLASTPEPAAATLLSLSLLGLAIRRRK